MSDSIHRRSRRGTLAGQIVAGHELLSVLATGGMGDVYRARHIRLDMQRAIKVIRGSERHDPVAAHRFEQEAMTLSRLQHNSIVQVIDFGELPNGWPFLVMEYIEGPNLDQLVEGLGPLAIPDALIILEQIGTALAYAHANKVIHRDLKPANVLVRVGDIRQVKIIDFGLALTLSGVGQRFTEQGQILGSPMYLAPEQADGSLDVTPAVDAYALAGVAYTLISGKPPFVGLSLLQLLYAHAAEQPPRLSARCPQLPKLLDDLLFCCLAKQPSERPRLDEIVEHLGRLARAAAEQTPGGTIGFAETISIASSERKATMHQEVAANPHASSSLTQLLAEAAADTDEHREALLNQLLAVVNELAVALSARDPSLGALIRNAEEISEQLTDLEMEVAVLDSHLEAAASVDLDRERAELVARVTRLRVQAATLQRQLVVQVESLRGVAGSASDHLFREVDEVAARLRTTNTMASSS